MIFDRLMNKKTIEKSDIMSIVNKFKALKDVNPERYTTITNKAIGLNPSFKKMSFKGRIKPKDWNKLSLIYEDFKDMVN